MEKQLASVSARKRRASPGGIVYRHIDRAHVILILGVDRDRRFGHNERKGLTLALGGGNHLIILVQHLKAEELQAGVRVVVIIQILKLVGDAGLETDFSVCFIQRYFVGIICRYAAVGIA